MAIELSEELAENLLNQGWTTEQVQALGSAMANSGVDPHAMSYAQGMGRAWDEFGMEGIKTQILYLLMNLAKWKGDEARQSKKVLRAIK